MHHVPGPGETHWYWVLHGIAPGVTNIDDNAVPSAKVGSNSVNDRNEYAPPCSKGPGAKQYIFTVYALSKVPAFSDSEKVTRQVLLDAINASVLATASLTVTSDRTSVVRAGVAP